MPAFLTTGVRIENGSSVKAHNIISMIFRQSDPLNSGGDGDSFAMSESQISQVESFCENISELKAPLGSSRRRNIIICFCVTLVLTAMVLGGGAIIMWSSSERKNFTRTRNISNPTVIKKIELDDPMSLHQMKMGNSNDVGFSLKLSPQKREKWQRLGSIAAKAIVYAVAFNGPFSQNDILHILETFSNVQNLTFHLTNSFCTALDDDDVQESLTYDLPLNLDSLLALKIVGSHDCGHFYPFLIRQLELDILHLDFTNLAILSYNVDVISAIISRNEKQLQSLIMRDITLGHGCNLFEYSSFPRVKVAHLTFAKIDSLHDVVTQTIKNFLKSFNFRGKPCDSAVEDWGVTVICD